MEKKSSKLQNIIDTILRELQEYKEENITVHPYDIAEQLLDVREVDFEQYLQLIKKIPDELFAEIVPEMPEHVQEELAEHFHVQKIANIASKMDTDDAADFIQSIHEDNEEIANTILDRFEDEDKQVIEQLMSYGENEAGAYMQTELFAARLSDQIGERIAYLKQAREEGELEDIASVHITDDEGRYIGSVGMEELILYERDQYFSEIPQDKYKPYVVNHKAHIDEVVEMFTHYNLASIPVVDDDNKLIGRITSDDIVDVIQESATEQIYNLAGVDDDVEQEEDIWAIGKARATWLGVNLLTAIAASLVIGLFDSTIQSIVALAVLMPIVASMGGNAGTQTLTVTVRQMALGDIEGSDAQKTIMKEVLLSLLNGFLFAVVIGIVAYLWFDMPLLGVVIGLSMIINLFSAGFFGSVIPLLLKKLNLDPAIGSTVLLTTVTDIVGFFSFLGLAKVILL